MGWLSKLFGGMTGGGGTPMRDALADRGENLAARYLRDQGFKIILRNYSADVGEIDIIAREKDTLVFVEVKTRETDDPRPEDQVNEVKQHQITKAAKTYLSRYGVPRPPSRFDVVAVLWPKQGQPEIRHTRSAFEPTF